MVGRRGCKHNKGLWFMVYGLWFTVYGLRFMVYGLWFMVYGLWFMVCGLWFVVWLACLFQHHNPWSRLRCGVLGLGGLRFWVLGLRFWVLGFGL